MRQRSRRGFAIQAETSSACTRILPKALDPGHLSLESGRKASVTDWGSTVLSRPRRGAGSVAYWSQASPALERGQYEKQMDHHGSCRRKHFAWRRLSSGTFLQPYQVDQEESEPHGKRTACCEQRGRKETVSAVAGGSASAYESEVCLRGI